MYIDNKIKTVVLVGTNIRDIYNNSSYLNFAQQRINESENRNYYFGAGPNLLNESVYSFMNLEKMNQNLWMSLLQFDFRKNFFFLFGKKDDAINLGVRKNSKKNINLLNKINEKIVGFKNIEFLENDEDHNFAKNNNLIAIKYFNKKFYGTETLDENVNYKKNNKEELLPIKYKFDLKKYYLDSFLKIGSLLN